MSYMPNNQYTQLTGDFVLGAGATCYSNILLQDGNLTVEPNAAFTSEVKLVGTSRKVTLEEHAFIYHLHLMNGGDIYIKGEHVLIVELIAEDSVTLHIPKPLTDWKQSFETISNEGLITIVQDID